MKVSEFLREYQITGKVPELTDGNRKVSLYAGMLMGYCAPRQVVFGDASKVIEMQIVKALEIAEAIEECAAPQSLGRRIRVDQT